MPERRPRFWIGLVVALLVASEFVVIPYWLWSTAPEDPIRYSGLLLQLLGIGTGVWGVYKHLKTLEPEPVISLIPTADAGARGLPTRFIVTASSVEDRLSGLEASIVNVHATLDRLREQVTDQGVEFRKGIESERAQRENAFEHLRVDAKERAALALLPESMGLLWLVFGAILGTAPELATAACRWIWP